MGKNSLESQDLPWNSHKNIQKPINLGEFSPDLPSFPGSCFLCVFYQISINLGHGFFALIWGGVCIIGRIQNAEPNQGHKKKNFTSATTGWVGLCVLAIGNCPVGFCEFIGNLPPQIVIPLFIGLKKGLQRNVGINCHTLTEHIMCQNYKITNTKFALITTKPMPQDNHSFSGC